MEAHNTKKACENCIFFQRELTPMDRKGTCRRYAPSPVLRVAVSATSDIVLPFVEADHWCGEFILENDINNPEDANTMGVL